MAKTIADFTGSYTGSTMIAHLAEAGIDIFVVLRPEYFGSHGAALLLGRVRRVLLHFSRSIPILRKQAMSSPLQHLSGCSVSHLLWQKGDALGVVR